MKLKVIDSFIYFKIKDESVQAAAYLPQRDAVKHHRLPLKDIFQIGDNIETSKELKIAFFDAAKLTEAFKQFDHDSIQGEIEFLENEEDVYLYIFDPGNHHNVVMRRRNPGGTSKVRTSVGHRCLAK